jgi:aspartyl-tRNA synthetase
LGRIRDGESTEATEKIRDLDNENTELLESNKNNLEQIYELKEKIISNERLQAEFHELKHEIENVKYEQNMNKYFTDNPTLMNTNGTAD